jgi:sulfopyruvate decarboxylase TPP-binding subunit
MVAVQRRATGDGSLARLAPDVLALYPRGMTVSYHNSKTVYEGIRAAGIRSISALPETWLGLLLQRAEDDPEMTLIQVAKEEEAIGVAAGAYFAGEPHLLLMQNHGFLAAINGIVSLAQLYHVPLCMLIALRGHGGRSPCAVHTVRICAGPGAGRAADT